MRMPKNIMKKIKPYLLRHFIVMRRIAPIGEWIRTQIKLNRSGKITAERKALLDKIGIDRKTDNKKFTAISDVKEIIRCPDNYNFEVGV
ncbi:MAG: helicase associated domain-containing protein [Clostridia bacterium]